MKQGAIAVLITMVLLATCRGAEREVEPVVMDPAELEAFADGFFPAQMEELHIPGVSFVLVQNGEIILVKGYGAADLETGKPISAEMTVMRIG